MKLRNNFSEETRAWFLDAEYQCFKCGSNQGVEAHHITGRDSNSPLNLAPLCLECHSHIGHTREEEKELFIKTLEFLLIRGYNVSEKDKEFVDKHPYLKP